LNRVFTTIGHEVRAAIPPTLFFFVGFNLILFTKRLFLADYLLQYTGFLVATTGALIVGKVVLVADAMPFLRRFDHRPLIYPILFKATVYTALVFVARLIEALIHYLVEGGVLGHGGFIADLVGGFSWAHFTAVQLWIFVLFLIYVAVNELDQRLGKGRLTALLFSRDARVD
jgi:hypothetical protein